MKGQRRAVSEYSIAKKDDTKKTDTKQTLTVAETVPAAIKYIAIFFAVLNITNGLWMLFAPKHWYWNLPANVPAFGPLNTHFIMDLGYGFGLQGVGLIIGLLNDKHVFKIMWSINTAFYTCHMFVHIYEVVSGNVMKHVFWVDFPGVYVPALVLLVASFFLFKPTQKKRGSRSHRELYTALSVQEN
jgi:hypothetical protein